MDQKLVFSQMQAKLGMNVFVYGIVVNSLQSKKPRKSRAISVYVLFSCG